MTAAKKKELTVDDVIEYAEKNINEHTHSLLKVQWVTVRDALVQLKESEKRYDLLYGGGRVTEGKDANKNLPRDTANRVE